MFAALRIAHVGAHLPYELRYRLGHMPEEALDPGGAAVAKLGGMFDDLGQFS